MPRYKYYDINYESLQLTNTVIPLTDNRPPSPRTFHRIPRVSSRGRGRGEGINYRGWERIFNYSNFEVFLIKIIN